MLLHPLNEEFWAPKTAEHTSDDDTALVKFVIELRPIRGRPGPVRSRAPLGGPAAVRAPGGRAARPGPPAGKVAAAPVLLNAKADVEDHGFQWHPGQQQSR